MGYELCAFIAEEAVLQNVAENFRQTVMSSLPQGFALLPNSNEFFDEVTSTTASELDSSYTEFWKLSLALHLWALKASDAGPIAYVEAEFFGGVGTQSSIVWNSGKVLFGPVFVGEKESRTLDHMPINQALRQLGVERGNHIDEFEALKLNKYRHTDEWIQGS